MTELPAYYLITPTPDNMTAFLIQLEQRIQAGIHLVQLRFNQTQTHSPDDIKKLQHGIQRLTEQYPVTFLINSHTDKKFQLRHSNYGIHLSSHCLLKTLSRPLPKTRPVAASCHSLTELQQACHIGIDFVVLSPVLPTQTHPNAMPLGWSNFANLVAQSTIPVYALGGMKPKHIQTAIAQGAQGCAGIRHFWNNTEVLI